MPKENRLQDYPVNPKIKLSVLWASVTLCYLYGDYFELYVPGKVDGLIKGYNMLDSPVKLLAAGILLAIPAGMVCLNVLLRPSILRWLNIIFGSFFTLIMLLIAVTSLEAWLAFYVFLAIVESILTALIIWHAWCWPRNAA
ncbi:DUF6326 family protein [Chitinophaga sp. 212800010-3]|uniref:DUF6326 family protein n=1 Tax=unclassified Chitinophaga TaxID=2619133 RepID=UPI002DECF300|nr:DUF4064 domain-containing protein [Chitinophaga sp. 212800010-3]